MFQTLPAQTVASPATVTVNFGSSRATMPANGLLLGDIAGLSTSAIMPLQPKLWRFSANSGLYLPFSTSGTALQFVLSDLYCYPSANWCGRVPPYQDWPGYEAIVRQAAQNMRGQNVMFDVWNEPDYNYYWSGTNNQFFQTYLHAYQVIREVLGPSVLIGGPSSSMPYNKTFLQAFLDFCNANGCEVNFLSWHEFIDVDSAILSISSHILDAKSSFMNNPKYARLNMKRIDINEMIGPTNAHRPGAILAYLDQIEKGGAGGASKACWPDSKGQNECFNGTLDGLLTSDTQQPRSAWWAIKAYADGATTRVASTATDPHVIALASKPVSASASAQVLIGYFNGTVSTPIQVSVNLNGLAPLWSLSANGTVSVEIDEIPDSGESELWQPIRIGQRDLQLSGGIATTTLVSVAPGQVYRLTLSPE